MKDILKVVLTDTQAGEYQNHLIDTSNPKGELVGNTLHVTRSQALQAADAIRYDYDLDFGIDVPASRKRTMLTLGKKLQKLALT